MKATIITTLPDESLELYLSVYDAAVTKKAFITEEFLVKPAVEGLGVGKGTLFELDRALGALYLVVRVVKLIPSSSPGGVFSRVPEGVAVTPLKAVQNGQDRDLGGREVTMPVLNWGRDDIFASMHEALIEGVGLGTGAM